MRDSSSSANNIDDFDGTHNSSPKNKSNRDFEGLPDNYLCGGLPNKMSMEALKELNISDIKEFLNNDTSKRFKKQKRAPPPQYHLESNGGDVKDRLIAFQLQFNFGGCQLRDYNLLSKLGTGLSVVDNDQDIPTVGELVNCKHGKRQRKGSKATVVPLEVVGIDIGYDDGASYG